MPPALRSPKSAADWPPVAPAYFFQTVAGFAGPGTVSRPSNVGAAAGVVAPSGCQRRSVGRFASEQSYCWPVVAFAS